MHHLRVTGPVGFIGLGSPVCPPVPYMNVGAPGWAGFTPSALTNSGLAPLPTDLRRGKWRWLAPPPYCCEWWPLPGRSGDGLRYPSLDATGASQTALLTMPRDPASGLRRSRRCDCAATFSAVPSAHPAWGCGALVVYCEDPRPFPSPFSRHRLPPVSFRAASVRGALIWRPLRP